MATIAEMLVKVGADVSNFEKSFDAIEKKTKTASERMKNAGSTMSKWVTAPALAGGAALIGLGVKTSGAMDRIDKMSQKLGLSREGFQQWDFILSQSGTSVESMQQGMKRLSQGMDEAALGTGKGAETFDRLGISVTDASGQMKSQEQVFEEAVTKLQGMEDGAEKAALANELFGRSGQELMPLLNGAGGSVDELKQKANELGLVMGDDAVDAGVKMTDTIDQMKRGMAAAGLAVGAELLPHFQKFGDWFVSEGIPKIKDFGEKIATLIGWFVDLPGPIQAIIAGFTGLLVAAGPLLLIAAALTNAISTIIPVAKAVGLAIGGISLPVVATIAAIAALIAIGIAVWKNWDTIKAKAIEIWGYIRDWLSQTWESIKEIAAATWEGIKAFFVSTWNSIKEFAVNTFNAVKEFFANTWQSIKDTATNTWNGIKSFFTNIINAIVDFFKSRWENLKSNTMAVFNAVKSFLTSAWNNIKSTISNAITTIVNFVKTRFNNMKTNITNVLNGIKSLIQNIWNNVKSIIQNAVQAIVNLVKGDFEGMKRNIQNILNNIRDLVRSIWDGIKSFLSGINLVSVGKDIMMGLFNGIASMAGKLKQKAADIANGIKDKIKGALKIASPSKVMRFEVGQEVGAGMIVGMDDMERKINKSAQSMAASAIPDVPTREYNTQPNYQPVFKIINTFTGEDVRTYINQENAIEAQTRRF